MGIVGSDEGGGGDLNDTPVRDNAAYPNYLGSF